MICADKRGKLLPFVKGDERDLNKESRREAKPLLQNNLPPLLLKERGIKGERFILRLVEEKK